MNKSAKPLNPRITLTIGGRDVEFTMEELTALKKQIDALFPSQPVYVPIFRDPPEPQYPIPHWRPPEIWCRHDTGNRPDVPMLTITSAHSARD